MLHLFWDSAQARLAISDRQLREEETGDQSPRARARRGRRRPPSWCLVARWRYRWTPEVVRAVLELIGAKATPAEISHATGLALIAVTQQKSVPDLRGFDTTLIPEEERARWRSMRPFDGQDLSYWDFRGARLTRIGLQGADLSRADFRKATLRDVDFSDSILTKGNFFDADMRGAVFDRASVGFIQYSEDGWLSRGTVMLHEARLAGAIDVDPLLDRYARDQSYIYVLKHKNRNHRGRSLAIRLWWLTSNYGQSLILWSGWSVLVILLLAFAFTQTPRATGVWGSLIQAVGLELSYPSGIDSRWPMPLYLSASNFMTVGPGNIRPDNAISQFMILIELLIGYLMFGVLISILANKVARRS
jgi:hypothetical protein